MSNKRPVVLIVGGGFGGLSAARALKNAPVQVILIDPLTDKFGGAMAAVAALSATGLFHGQTKEFFSTIPALLTAADAAVRER